MKFLRTIHLRLVLWNKSEFKKLGRTPTDRNIKALYDNFKTNFGKGIADFSSDTDTLGDAYEYLIGSLGPQVQVRKPGDFTPPQESHINFP